MGFPLLVGSLILALVFNERAGTLSPAYTHRGLLFLGEMSYSLYMLHVPLIAALRRGLKSLGLFDPEPINGKAYNLTPATGALFR